MKTQTNNNPYTPKVGLFGSLKSVVVESAQTVVSTARAVNVSVQDAGIVTNNATGLCADASGLAREIANMAMMQSYNSLKREYELEAMHEQAGIDEASVNLNGNDNANS